MSAECSNARSAGLRAGNSSKHRVKYLFVLVQQSDSENAKRMPGCKNYVKFLDQRCQDHLFLKLEKDGSFKDVKIIVYIFQ